MDNPAFQLDSENEERLRKVSTNQRDTEGNSSERTVILKQESLDTMGSYGSVSNDNIPDPLEHASDGTVQMKRQIGLLGGVSLIVGTMIGSGIFISPSGLLRRTGSVAVSLIVWFGCGLLSTLSALAYCELGTVVPRSGGEHAYYMAAYAPLHKFLVELPAFLLSWLTVLLLKLSSLAIASMPFGQYCIAAFVNYFDFCDNYRETAEY